MPNKTKQGALKRQGSDAFVLNINTTYNERSHWTTEDLNYLLGSFASTDICDDRWLYVYRSVLAAFLLGKRNVQRWLTYYWSKAALCVESHRHNYTDNVLSSPSTSFCFRHLPTPLISPRYSFQYGPIEPLVFHSKWGVAGIEGKSCCTWPKVSSKLWCLETIRN